MNKHGKTQLSTEPKKAKKPGAVQQAWAYLLLLPFILFALSGFTCIPRTAQTPNVATGTTRPLTMQMNALLTTNAKVDDCFDVVYVDQISLEGIKIYLNLCAMQHLNAITDGVDAGTALMNLVTLICPECAPVIVGITAITGGISAVILANVASLEYAAQGCGGAFLDISWTGGWQFEPACGSQDYGS